MEFDIVRGKRQLAGGRFAMVRKEMEGIVRLLYRSLLRVSVEVERELQRGNNFLAERELEAITKLAGLNGKEGRVGGASGDGFGDDGVVVVRGDWSLKDLIRQAFKNGGLETDAKQEKNIDAGLRTLKYINLRLPVLRKLVYRNSSNTVTNGVRVKVSSHFLGRDNFGYKFAYNVRVANECAEPVTLVNREWIIVDSDGREDVVRGPGVVGQQPVIQPGSTYEYNSGTPLRTTMGSMWGKYEMVKQNKREVRFFFHQNQHSQPPQHSQTSQR